MGVSPQKFSRVVCHLELVLKTFEEYRSIFKFPQKQNFSMVDIGTGPGTLLLEMETVLPKTYKEIICTDRSKEMIEYFDSLPKDPRISTRILDISEDKMPDDLKKRFDLAFSSFCFAYVPDLRKTLQNCSDLLKPEGETYFVWSIQSHVYEVFRSLSRIDKWAPYTKDFKNWKSLSEYKDPMGILQSHVESTGLKTLKLLDYKDFVFEDSEDFILDTFESMDHIMHRIPQIDQKKYKEDFNHIVRSEQLVIIDESCDGRKSRLSMPALALIARKF